MDRGKVEQLGAPEELYDAPQHAVRRRLHRDVQPARGHGRSRSTARTPSCGSTTAQPVPRPGERPGRAMPWTSPCGRRPSSSSARPDPRARRGPRPPRGDPAERVPRHLGQPHRRHRPPRPRIQVDGPARPRAVRDRRRRPDPLARRRCDGARPARGRASPRRRPSEPAAPIPTPDPVPQPADDAPRHGDGRRRGAALRGLRRQHREPRAPPRSPTAAPSSAARLQRAARRPPTPTAEPTPVPSPEGELFVYNWADYIGENTIKKFEDTYGIKVTVRLLRHRRHHAGQDLDRQQRLRRHLPDVDQRRRASPSAT